MISVTSITESDLNFCIHLILICWCYSKIFEIVTFSIGLLSTLVLQR